MGVDHSTLTTKRERGYMAEPIPIAKHWRLRLAAIFKRNKGKHHFPAEPVEDVSLEELLKEIDNAIQQDHE